MLPRFYWAIQWQVVAATKRGNTGILSRFPNEDGSYSPVSFRLQDSHLEAMSEDELEELRAKSALVAFYRWTKVTMDLIFGGPLGCCQDPILTELYQMFYELSLPGPERTLSVFEKRGFDGPDAFIVDVTSQDEVNSVGNGIGDELDEYVCNDGWNECGTDRGTGMSGFVEPFKDTIGYYSKHQANVGGDRRAWAPIGECSLGFCAEQEHVTPQIGFTARTYFMNEDERESSISMVQRPFLFDYEDQILDVLDATASIANEPEWKTVIATWDNKFNFASATIGFVRSLYGHKFEDRVYITMGFQAAEHEGIVLNWGAKVRNDHVRPTIVSQEILGDEPIENFFFGGEGLATYPAEQWNAYIRVMPHAEFPSGSACLCYAASDYIAETLGFDIGDKNPFAPEDYTFTFKAGSNTVEPRLPAEDFTHEYFSLQDIAHECAESRYRGGMHFYNSLKPGADMCTTYNDFTKKGVAYNKFLWTGNPSFIQEFGGSSKLGFDGDREFVYQYL